MASEVALTRDCLFGVCEKARQVLLQLNLCQDVCPYMWVSGFYTFQNEGNESTYSELHDVLKNSSRLVVASLFVRTVVLLSTLKLIQVRSWLGSCN